MTEKTYEQVAAEHWPKEPLPADDGARCPPFLATLFRLAESLANDRPLTPELQQVHEHLDECDACRSTVSAVAPRFKAEPAESTSEVIGGVSWEGTPLRRLRDHAKNKVYISGETLKDVFTAVCFAADVTEPQAFKAVGWPEEGRKWLAECAEIAIWLLSDLGVERSVLERAIDCQFPAIGADAKPTMNTIASDSYAKHPKMILHQVAIAAKTAGSPKEVD
jgi:hypothetical protein